MSKNDGGPAFPQVYLAIAQGENVTLDAAHPVDLPQGMSLRDWFKGKALEGLLSNPVFLTAAIEASEMAGISVAEDVTFRCCNFADAMLKEREDAKE